MAVGYPRAPPVAVPIAQQPQPRSFASLPRTLVAGVVARPEQPPRGVPIAPLPKVNPVLPVAPSSEQGNPRDRERSREDSTVVVINDRKPSFGNGEPILPRPLPASVVDSRISDKENNDAADADSDEEPQKNAEGEYNASDLLKQHVKRAKKIRAGLQKERLRRIERYKQRLALLL
ncbi:hypothetical protein BAE44_0004842 [Dichanthelium oligosanthes]|uniref:Uncharacterized protein n=1 Tax=Dichanthelium oligosanthes TaxID=888268 RepID=A0A1E5WA70_9POAL|nr:hypothetical protein BAE44_0004842 [Dichanthelium oligosanthes]